ncbi:MAG: DNA polymerase IV [Spirochaetales bacterium]
MKPKEPVFFHVDLDAFFASVEQQDNPAYQGLPVIVGARPGQRGVVSACSYEARAFGVRSAMPIAEAFRLCPKGIFLPVRMKRYIEVSQQVMEVFNAFTPSWIPLSIDEASLDMTGTEKIFTSPRKAAIMLKEKVRKISGLTLSIGIASNRYLAKLASEFKKPDGLYRVHPMEELSFIDSVGIEKLHGIGPKTLMRLRELGWNSPQLIRALPLSMLQRKLGKALGEFLYLIVQGKDPGIYKQTPKSHSLSQERTFPSDLLNKEEVEKTLLSLAQEVMFRLYKEQGHTRTVRVKVRYPDFTTKSSHRTLNHSLQSAEELFQIGWDLLNRIHTFDIPIRLLGLGVENIFIQEGLVQQELFPLEYEKQRLLEKTILELQQKNPTLTLKKASLL